MRLRKISSSGVNWCSCCGEIIPSGVEILEIGVFFTNVNGVLVYKARYIVLEHLLDWLNFNGSVKELNKYLKV